MIKVNKEQGTKNILVVDDDQAGNKMLSMLLKTRGYKVESARNAEELYKNINEATDLVILDYSLPDKDGFSICRELKENAKTKHIPVIILSGHMLAKDVAAGLYLGADDCLLKPVESEELMARMEAVTRRNNAKSEEAYRHQEKEIICELARIIQDEDIVPYFQPIVNFSNCSVVGFEALCRPNSNILSNPEVLFKMALKYGMYRQLELLSWKKAADIFAPYTGDIKLFLNCNPYFIEGDNLDNALGIILKAGIKPQDVQLEITERSEVSDYKYFYNQLKNYRSEGFKFAVDDVGGGFASLESIVRIKPEVLKIERHIVSNLDRDKYKCSMVKFILAFCEENGISCVAEGVETRREYEYLMNMGVNAGQGYYFYRPSPKIDLLDIQEKLWKC